LSRWRGKECLRTRLANAESRKRGVLKRKSEQSKKNRKSFPKCARNEKKQLGSRGGWGTKEHSG